LRDRVVQYLMVKMIQMSTIGSLVPKVAHFVYGEL
jgi:hypothetical protein